MTRAERIRRDKKLKVSEVAKVCGVSVGTVRSVLNGGGQTGAYSADRVASAVGCSLLDFITADTTLGLSGRKRTADKNMPSVLEH